MIPKKFIAKFDSKKQLTSNVWQLDFEVPENQPFEFIAGQYLILDCEGKGKRMYSIASLPSENNKFTFIANYFPGGLASEYFMEMQKGQDISFVGPLGKFMINKTDASKTFLITGTGIAPAWSMINFALSSKSNFDIKLFWGLKNLNETYFQNELKSLVTNFKNFEYQFCISRESIDIDIKSTNFFQGRFTDALKQREDKINLFLHSEFYLCGSGKIVEETKSFLRDMGVGRERIFYERFD